MADAVELCVWLRVIMICHGLEKRHKTQVMPWTGLIWATFRVIVTSPSLRYVVFAFHTGMYRPYRLWTLILARDWDVPSVYRTKDDFIIRTHLSDFRFAINPELQLYRKWSTIPALDSRGS